MWFDVVVYCSSYWFNLEVNLRYGWGFIVVFGGFGDKKRWRGVREIGRCEVVWREVEYCCDIVGEWWIIIFY